MGATMSDFVQFPLDVYQDEGKNAFAGFDGTATKFTLHNALAMMWFAQLAYEVDTTGTAETAAAAKIDTIRKLWDFEPVSTFRKESVAAGGIFDTTGLVGKRRDAVVLAFAGTDPFIWQTVATDAGFRIGSKNTHKGFQAAFDAVATVDSTGAVSGPVGDAIARSKATGLPLFITGHSLGAALAILAADAAVVAGVTPRAVYGFGTPRPGGAAFQARYNAALGDVTYRLVHGRDVVARVPMFPGYLHVGRVLQCDSNTKFDAGKLSAAVSDDPSFAEAALNEIKGLLQGKDLLTFFGRFFSSREGLVKRLLDSIQPPGKGPLKDWFRFLPPPIREHLEDRYIEALTPGTIKIRED